MAKMTLERAREIVGHMVRITMHTEGVPLAPAEQPDLAVLREVSLAEMVEANRMAREAPKEWEAQPDGSKRRLIHITCDDRLTAAIYAALHYEAEEITGRPLEPIVRIGDNALLLVKPAPAMEEEDDG